MDWPSQCTPFLLTFFLQVPLQELAYPLKTEQGEWRWGGEGGGAGSEMQRAVYLWDLSGAGGQHSALGVQEKQSTVRQIMLGPR